MPRIHGTNLDGQILTPPAAGDRKPAAVVQVPSVVMATTPGRPLEAAVGEIEAPVHGAGEAWAVAVAGAAGTSAAVVAVSEAAGVSGDSCHEGY